MFRRAVGSEIYVDKTRLIDYTNKVFRSEQQNLCVSRPRRFGKSMAANMLSAYYDRTADSKELFAGLQISGTESFAKHLNKYDVIKVNMQDFLSRTKDVAGLIALLQKAVTRDLRKAYPQVDYLDGESLSMSMADIYEETQNPFVVIIDEWDCVFRDCSYHQDWQRRYLDFLREWLKDKSYIGLAYMTGILPIKKYGTHSALNMFKEFSMENPGELVPYVGFTREEVQELCARYGRDFEECCAWYDGYAYRNLGVNEIYNPRSVVEAVSSGVFDTYWNKTETFEALKVYIDMDYDGLREAVIALMAKEPCRIDTGHFANDMTTFHDMDDVLTLLIHLGYLGYDFADRSVFIPNREIMQEYVNATRTGGWDEVARAVRQSDSLLEATLAKDAEAVADGIEEAHLETSHLQYNDENALSYTLSLAYYTARQKYIIVREFPTGKGFADLVFLPRRSYMYLPAMVIELKWDKSAETAIRQIKAKKYPHSLENYAGELLLVGISYDRKTKVHECAIESW